MRYFLFGLVLLFCFHAKSQTTENDIVISNVNVIDIENNKILPLQNVFIKNGKVKISGEKLPDIAYPKLIDGSKKYFMPAMWDMHVHFPDKDADKFFKLVTLAGITNCRIMKSNDSTISFTKKAFMAPKLKIAYNFFSDDKHPLFQIKNIVDSLKVKGYHFIKIFGVKDETYFDEIMKAAKRNKLIVCGHALSNVNPKKVLASGYKSIEHVGYFDKAKTPEALDSLIQIAKANNVYICPTLDWSMMVYHSVPKDSLVNRAGYEIGKTLYENDWDSAYKQTIVSFGDNSKKYIVGMKNSVNAKIDVLTKLKNAGINIIAGSDAEEPFQTPGFSLIEELKWIKKAGFTNNELLKMVTINAESFYGESKGKSGDYILLEKNPIEDISNLESVEYVIKPNELINVKSLLKKLRKTKNNMLNTKQE